MRNCGKDLRMREFLRRLLICWFLFSRHRHTKLNCQRIQSDGDVSNASHVFLRPFCLWGADSIIREKRMNLGFWKWATGEEDGVGK